MINTENCTGTRGVNKPGEKNDTNQRENNKGTIK